MRKFEFILDVLSYRGVDPDTATCIEILHHAMPGQFMVIYRTAIAAHTGRSIEATRFMNNYDGVIEAPYMIFLDDDELFKPEDVNKILTHLREGKRCVGGIYSVRNGKVLSSQGLNERGTIAIDGSLQEIRMLATGFMGIEKSLFIEIKDKLKLPLLHKDTWQECYPFFLYTYGQEDGRGEMIFSEDYEFCRKVREIGEKVYADTSVQIGHIGRYVYTVEDVIRNQEKHLDFSNQRRIP